MIRRIVGIGVIVGLVLGFVFSFAEAEENKAGLIIKVEPGIIGIPKNVERFPLSRASVRSTELRELNQLYGAVIIERVYEIRKVGNKPEEKVALEDTYVIWFGDEFLDMEEVSIAYGDLETVEFAQIK